MGVCLVFGMGMSISMTALVRSACLPLSLYRQIIDTNIYTSLVNAAKYGFVQNVTQCNWYFTSTTMYVSKRQIRLCFIFDYHGMLLDWQQFAANFI